MADLKIEMIDIEKVIPYARNAKEHPPEQVAQIAASIKEFGFNDPCAVDKDNVLIEGHGRILAAQVLGMKKVPIIRLDHMTEAQKKAYILAHNKLTMNSGFNLDMLKIELGELKSFGFDLPVIGFNTDELKELFTEKKPKKQEDDAFVDDLIGQADKGLIELIAKPGELWALGGHRLLCADCTDPENIKRLMNGAMVDAVFTDPPYNVAYVGKTAEAMTIQNDKMDDLQFRAFLHAFYKNAVDITKPGGAIYVFHADSEGYNFRGALKDAGWLMKQCLIWVKNCMVMGRQDYHWKHEPVLYGWKPGAAHNWYTDRKQTTILNFDRPSRSADHPTTKPVPMLEYLINNSTAPGQQVFDGFLGSGTTLIAAEQTGRQCYGTEIDPKYASVIIRRWEALSGQKAQKLD